MTKLDEDLTGQELAEKRLIGLLNAVSDTRSKIEATARLCLEAGNTHSAEWMATRAAELEVAMDAASAAPYRGKSHYDSYRSQVEEAYAEADGIRPLTDEDISSYSYLLRQAKRQNPNFCLKCENILPPGTGCKRLDGCPRIQDDDINWNVLHDACNEEPTEETRAAMREARSKINWKLLHAACNEEPTEADKRMVADMMAGIRQSETNHD